jgi:hypothetical protein
LGNYAAIVHVYVVDSDDLWPIKDRHLWTCCWLISLQGVMIEENNKKRQSVVVVVLTKQAPLFVLA